MAKPSPHPTSPPRLLVLELWGLGDVGLAIPFLRAASAQAKVTLVGKPHAAPLLRRFAPTVEHLPFVAPWTAFTGKYRVHRWPWRALFALRRELRARQFDFGLSARPDPRDHALLWLAGAKRRFGFPRTGSRLILTDPLPRPPAPHRAEHWDALLRALDSAMPRPTEASATQPDRHPSSEVTGDSSGATGTASPAEPVTPRRILMHTGAGHRVRMWPRDRFDALAERLRELGWQVTVIDDSVNDVDRLIELLAATDRFIGNDSGPGHIAALLGVPTFTIFGPQLPELFAPRHPDAQWIEGAPCEYKPCFDACRFAEPFCLTRLSVDAVCTRVCEWLAHTATPTL